MAIILSKIEIKNGKHVKGVEYIGMTAGRYRAGPNFYTDWEPPSDF